MGSQPGGCRVSASHWPSARGLAFVTSSCGVFARALSLSPLPGHEASRTIQFMQKRQGRLRPHRQQRRQTDSAESAVSGWAGPRWGPAVLLLRASSWACEGLACRAGRGHGPPGVPGARGLELAGPPSFPKNRCALGFARMGPSPTRRPVAVVSVGEGSGTLCLRVRQLVSGRCLRALPKWPNLRCQDVGATAWLWSSLLCDLGRVIEPLPQFPHPCEADSDSSQGVSR